MHILTIFSFGVIKLSRNKGKIKASRVRTDCEKLKLFVDKVSELRNTTLMRTNGLRYHFSMRIECDLPTKLTLEEPDEGDLRDYLITFRRFLSNEDVSLNHILNICQKRLTNVDLKQEIPILRQAWLETKQHSGMKLIMNGQEVLAEEIFDIWLNGRYFHDDLAYGEWLESLSSFLYKDVRLKFINFIIQASCVIIQMGLLVDAALQNNSFLFDETVD